VPGRAGGLFIERCVIWPCRGPARKRRNEKWRNCLTGLKSRKKSWNCGAKYIIDRKAKIAAGEPGPNPQQPKDYSGLFTITLENRGACTVGGGISVYSFEVAARRLVGSNFQPEARIATTLEIQSYWEAADARMAIARKADDALNQKRTVHVLPVSPKTRRAE
jgi:hypothetical protein